MRTAYLDPEATLANVAGLHRFLVESGLLRDGGLEDCDVVFCEWPRYEHFLRVRGERCLEFRLNWLPRASEVLHRKDAHARLLKRRPYTLETHVDSCRRRLRGVWVEKPSCVDRGEGITFLRDPRRWRREGHVLQRYVSDPWLIHGRKVDVRMLARIDDDATVRVFHEGVICLAHLPFRLDDLDPLIHNANGLFQRRSGAHEFEAHLLSEQAPSPDLLDAMVAIVHDTVRALGRKRRFRESRDFELMGYDFAVDRRGTPFLVEVNRSPGFNLAQGAVAHLYPRIIEALYRDL